MVVKIQNNELEVEIKSFGAELKSVKKNGSEKTQKICKRA